LERLTLERAPFCRREVWAFVTWSSSKKIPSLGGIMKIAGGSLTLFLLFVVFSTVFAFSQGQITTPAPGSVFGGSSVTFDWNAVTGASAYQLDLGSVANGHQYYQSGNLGNVLTTTATGLPTDGSTVYATLYWRITGVWSHGGFTYTAFCAAGIYCGAHPVIQNNVFNPPLNSTGYSQWTDLGTVLGNSNVTGVVALVPGGCISNCTNKVYLDSGSGTDSHGNYCPSVTTGLSNLDSFVTTVHGYGKLTNIVVAPASYGNNTQTPTGVFSQAWANLLDTDCSGNAASSSTAPYDLTWQSSHRYLPGEYVLVSGTYWQVKTGTGNYRYTPTNASANGTTATVTVSGTVSLQTNQYVTVTLSDTRFNVVRAQITGVGTHTVSYALAKTISSESVTGDVTGDATCISGTSGSFNTNPYSDGTGSTACSWSQGTSNAPPQDAWVGSSYSGLGGKAYSLSLNTTSNSCTSSACTVSLANPYVGSTGDSITVAGVTTGGGGTNLNCTGCSVTGITSSTVTYSDSNGTFSGTINSGATLVAQRHFNISSANGSTNVSVIASGLPTAYEPPMKAWIKYVCGQVYAHYASDSRVGYIRCGLTEGGEADTVGLVGNGTTNWPYGSQSVFVAYYNDFMGYVSNLASTNSLICMGNLNSFDLPEGQISISNNCGIGTNGYQVNDVAAINAGNCMTLTAIQSDWCWNFSTYNVAMSNGKYPILELQTKGASTPGTDTSGNTGGLSADSGCGSGNGCPWSGLIPIASSNLANDGEWYMCDIMLGDDTSYPNGCPDGSGTYEAYQSAYASALTAFLP
jgi:hypothetical protein